MANAQRTGLWWQMAEERIKRLGVVDMQELRVASSLGGARGHNTH